jgi:hypothetical protein
MAAFRSITDVMSAACTIQDALQYAGSIEPAEMLGKALYADRKTSAEALNAIAAALKEARYAVSRTLDAEMVRLLDDAVAGAYELSDDPVRQRSLLQTIAALFKR